MRILKLVIITLALLIFSGCSVEYNLVIKDNEFIENVTIVDLVTLEREKSVILDDYNDSYSALYIAPGQVSDYVNSFPIKTMVELENGYRINYQYTFNRKNYSNSRALLTGFKHVDFDINTDYISLKTISDLNLFRDYAYLDTVTVNIFTEYRVINNNADVITGNTYTWTFNRTNFQNKSIQLVLAKKSEETSVSEENIENKKNSIPTIIIIFSSFLAFGILLAIFIKIKAKRL